MGAWHAGRITALCLVAGTALVAYFANPQHHSPYDYTMRLAEALLHGRLGLDQPPPTWLNEMIPCNARYYAGFPLGAVLSMIPVAALKMAGLTAAFPSAAIVAVESAAAVFFFFRLAGLYGDSCARRVCLALFPVFGTWTLCDLAYGGAWQIELGFALAGQAGALYFVLVDRRPLLAGLLFAIAFGNRTEVILTAPVFLYLLLRPAVSKFDRRPDRGRTFFTIEISDAPVLPFLIVPILLGVCTLAYNFARFDSISDFGSARVPGVLQEPWYRHGIFSLRAIPANARAMLFDTWKRVPRFPYLTPNGFGGSIFLSCPLLLLLFRRGKHGDPAVRWSCWIAIGVLTLLLWTHGNTGGWQYSYRYATELLPWMFVLLVCEPRGRPWIESTLFGISVAVNTWATYLFLWTRYVQP